MGFKLTTSDGEDVHIRLAEQVLALLPVCPFHVLFISCSKNIIRNEKLKTDFVLYILLVLTHTHRHTHTQTHTHTQHEKRIHIQTHTDMYIKASK